jgi:hypothetical protein
MDYVLRHGGDRLIDDLFGTRVYTNDPNITLMCVTNTISGTALGAIPHCDYYTVIANSINKGFVPSLEFPSGVTRLTHEPPEASLFDQSPIYELRGFGPLRFLTLKRENSFKGYTRFDTHSGEILVYPEGHTCISVVGLNFLDYLLYSVFNPHPSRVIFVVPADFGRAMSCNTNLKH